MQSKSKWPTVLIVVITLGLVFGPVFVPREISRWYLAAAHNAFRKKDSVLAEHYLRQAEAWDANITGDVDYWIAQLPRADLQNTDQVLDLIEKAVMSDSRWRLRAYEEAQRLNENLDYQRAVRALKISNLGERPTNAEDLNLLAYTRAQACIELDAALADIDKAIDQAGPLPVLLDTKAWVLYGMKRNLEALGCIQKAIDIIEKPFAKGGVTLPNPSELELPKAATPSPTETESQTKVTDADRADVAQGDSDTSDLSFLDLPPEPPRAVSLRERQAEIRRARRRIGEAEFNLAIMRFHRLRILEALKRKREADEDRRWLEERGVPVVDELF